MPAAWHLFEMCAVVEDLIVKGLLHILTTSGFAYGCLGSVLSLLMLLKSSKAVLTGSKAYSGEVMWRVR